MAFIEFILISILVIYLLGLIGKLLLRVFIKRAQKNFEKQFGDGATGGFYKQYTWGMGGNNRGEAKPKEGEVKVSDGGKQKKINDKVGDYVDYEEIK